MFRRMQKRFLDWPLAKKFVVVFSVMTVLSGVLTVGALHLGLSRNPCRSWTFLSSGWTARSRTSAP